jgi:hypothetical protein
MASSLIVGSPSPAKTIDSNGNVDGDDNAAS